MRIVVVGNFNEQKAGANFYATIRKLANGFTRNGHAVMAFSDRDVTRLQGRFGVGRAGAGEANRRLVELCQRFRPQLVVLLHADIISNETIREMKAQAQRPLVAVVNLDPLFEAVNPPRVRRFGEAADITFLTTAGAEIAKYATATHRTAFIPNAADASIETLECFAHADQSFDLLCTIGAERGTPWRGEIMRAVQASVPDVSCNFFGLEGRPSIFGSDYFDAIANARMGLNLSRSDDHYLYSSDRLAQYAGNGLLVFVGRSTGYGEIFSEDEFAFYDGLDELADKLRYFRAHDGERQTVARLGHAKYHAIFNERLVARFIEEATFGRLDAADYAWPGEIYGG